MFARRSAEGVLQHLSGYSTIFAFPTVFMALFTTAPTDDSGTGAVEVTGGSYARVQISLSTTGTVSSGSNQLTALASTAGIVAGQIILGANIPAATTVVSLAGSTVTMSANATASGASEAVAFTSMNAATTSADPTTESNAAQIQFPAATANWGNVVAFGFYDAASAGNLLLWDWLGNNQWQPCTVSSASPAVFTAHAHGFTSGVNVVFSTVFGGVDPAGGGLTNSTVLAVSATGLTTDAFEVTTPALTGNPPWTGGSAVNTTGTGNGMVREIAAQAVPSGVQPYFAAGQLVLQAA